MCVCVCVFSAVSFYNTPIQPGYSCVQIVVCVCVCVCLVLFRFTTLLYIQLCVDVCVRFVFSAVSFQGTAWLLLCADIDLYVCVHFFYSSF